MTFELWGRPCRVEGCVSISSTFSRLPSSFKSQDKLDDIHVSSLRTFIILVAAFADLEAPTKSHSNKTMQNIILTVIKAKLAALKDIGECPLKAHLLAPLYNLAISHKDCPRLYKNLDWKIGCLLLISWQADCQPTWLCALTQEAWKIFHSCQVSVFFNNKHPFPKCYQKTGVQPQTQSQEFPWVFCPRSLTLYVNFYLCLNRRL